MEDRRKESVLRYGLPLGIALVVFLAFLPSLRAGFVNWDDDTNFQRNPYYRGLGAPQLRWMFTTFHMGHYQPLTWMTLGLDYVLWGENAPGYHFTSLLLHAANVVLFYFVILAVMRQVHPVESPSWRWPAAAAALFYGIHPLRVESVTWITERRDVLCGFFLLLSVLAYLRMVRARSQGDPWKRWLALSSVAFAASLLSKALGIMLPFALLVLDVYPLRRFVPGKRLPVLLEKLPFLALAVADGLIMLVAMSHLAAVRSLKDYAFDERLLQGAYGLGFYVWKTLVPTGLSPLYALGEGATLWTAEFVLPYLGVALAAAALFYTRRRWPVGPATAAGYAILLVPVLGFFVTGYQRAADRYTYLAALPLSLALAGGLAPLLPHARARTWIGAGAALWLTVLGVLTFRQAALWKDSFTLWDYVLQREQRSDLPYINRGSARRDRGDLDGALADFNQALRVNPSSAGAFNNRAMIRQAREDRGALADYDEALRLDPKMFEAWNNRASMKMMLRDWDGALADCNEALKLDASGPETYAIRGDARRFRREYDDAISDFQLSLRLSSPSWIHRKTVESMLEDARRRKAAADKLPHLPR